MHTSKTQTFNLSISSESLVNLPITVHQDINDIEIKVQITLDSDKLFFLYDLDIPHIIKAKITWKELSIVHNFTDYLWKDTCLECFIGQSSTKNYIEINASTEGNYAIYHFDDYRIPTIIPPKRLLLLDNNPMKLYWTASHGSYRRQFYIYLDDLIKDLKDFDLISPCVILNYLGTPLFFTSTHTSPADFHNRECWQQFSYNTK